MGLGDYHQAQELLGQKKDLLSRCPPLFLRVRLGVGLVEVKDSMTWIVFAESQSGEAS